MNSQVSVEDNSSECSIDELLFTPAEDMREKSFVAESKTDVNLSNVSEEVLFYFNESESAAVEKLQNDCTNPLRAFSIEIDGVPVDSCSNSCVDGLPQSKSPIMESSDLITYEYDFEGFSDNDSESFEGFIPDDCPIYSDTPKRDKEAVSCVKDLKMAAVLSKTPIKRNYSVKRKFETETSHLSVTKPKRKCKISQKSIFDSDCDDVTDSFEGFQKDKPDLINISKRPKERQILLQNTEKCQSQKIVKRSNSKNDIPELDCIGDKIKSSLELKVCSTNIETDDSIGRSCDKVGCSISWLESGTALESGVNITNGIVYELSEFAKRIAWEPRYVADWILRLRGYEDVSPSDEDLKKIYLLLKRRKALSITLSGKNLLKHKLQSFDMGNFSLPSSEKLDNKNYFKESPTFHSSNIEITLDIFDEKPKMESKKSKNRLYMSKGKKIKITKVKSTNSIPIKNVSYKSSTEENQCSQNNLHTLSDIKKKSVVQNITKDFANHLKELNSVTIVEEEISQSSIKKKSVAQNIKKDFANHLKELNSMAIVEEETGQSSIQKKSAAQNITKDFANHLKELNSVTIVEEETCQPSDPIESWIKPMFSLKSNFIGDHCDANKIDIKVLNSNEKMSCPFITNGMVYELYYFFKERKETHTSLVNTLFRLKGEIPTKSMLIATMARLQQVVKDLWEYNYMNNLDMPFEEFSFHQSAVSSFQNQKLRPLIYNAPINSNDKASSSGIHIGEDTNTAQNSIIEKNIDEIIILDKKVMPNNITIKDEPHDIQEKINFNNEDHVKIALKNDTSVMNVADSVKSPEIQSSKAFKSVKDKFQSPHNANVSTYKKINYLGRKSINQSNEDICLVDKKNQKDNSKNYANCQGTNSVKEPFKDIYLDKEKIKINSRKSIKHSNKDICLVEKKNQKDISKNDANCQGINLIKEPFKYICLDKEIIHNDVILSVNQKAMDVLPEDLTSKSNLNSSNKEKQKPLKNCVPLKNIEKLQCTDQNVMLKSSVVNNEEIVLQEEPVTDNDTNSSKGDSSSDGVFDLNSTKGNLGKITRGDIVYLYTRWLKKKMEGKETVFVTDLSDDVESLKNERKVFDIRIPVGTLMSSSVKLFEEFRSLAKSDMSQARDFLLSNWLKDLDSLINARNGPKNYAAKTSESLPSSQNNKQKVIPNKNLSNPEVHNSVDSINADIEAEDTCPIKPNKHVLKPIHNITSTTGSINPKIKSKISVASSEENSSMPNRKVKKIVGYRVVELGGQSVTEYRVRHAGLTSSSDAWIDESSIENTNLLKDFWNALSKQRIKKDPPLEIPNIIENRSPIKDSNTSSSETIAEFFNRNFVQNLDISLVNYHLGIEKDLHRRVKVSKAEVLQIYDKWRYQNKCNTITGNMASMDVGTLIESVKQLMEDKKVRNFNSECIVDACFRISLMRYKLKDSALKTYLETDFTELMKASGKHHSCLRVENMETDAYNDDTDNTSDMENIQLTHLNDKMNSNPSLKEKINDCSHDQTANQLTKLKLLNQSSTTYEKAKLGVSSECIENLIKIQM